MKVLTTKASVVSDIYNTLRVTPKDLEDAVTAGYDAFDTPSKFSKMRAKFLLPQVKAADEERNDVLKEIRREVKPLLKGKSPEEAAEISKPFDQKLQQSLADINEKHGLDDLTGEATVELSDEEHKLLKDIFPALAKGKFPAVEPMAEALEAITGAKEG